jgi:CheY-like chemotaxis protein
MPGQHGLDVLKWLRNEPPQVNLPVIVLTSSNQESDIHRAFLLGANGFIIKPGDPKQLVNIVKTIQDYWLGETRPPVSFVDFAAAANVAVLAGLYNGRKGPP